MLSQCILDFIFSICLQKAALKKIANFGALSASLWLTCTRSKGGELWKGATRNEHQWSTTEVESPAAESLAVNVIGVGVFNSYFQQNKTGCSNYSHCTLPHIRSLLHVLKINNQATTMYPIVYGFSHVEKKLLDMKSAKRHREDILVTENVSVIQEPEKRCATLHNTQPLSSICAEEKLAAWLALGLQCDWGISNKDI